MSRLSLKPRYWYAAEFYDEAFGDELRSYSPIKVNNVIPKGGRKFHLDFYHANYPSGVQNKGYDLQTIERNKHFIFAQSLGNSPRLLLIYPITFDWLNQHFNLDTRSDLAVHEWLNLNV
ncbi:hypothetical protein [Paraglaciecola chathamensis]|uniref:hypothetical protein n=1 Tax=Paraglaciecola chathamensis TaxID=368405 RepID=UPI0026F53CBA|nr:hypothetical protein [Paraglaciecola chathamensis]MDO6559401.1 hypothetical protein [Paraglaciecola chathamensis]